MPFIKRIKCDEELVAELSQEFTIVGRSESCDLRLASQHEISREHCGLRIYKDGIITVADLGSKNGTWVNGQRIFGETRLKDGDVVRLSSKVEFKFYAGDSVEDDDMDAPAPEEMTIADDGMLRRGERPKPKEKEFTATQFGRAAGEVEKELESSDFKDLMAKFSRQAKPKPKRKTDSDEEVW